MKPATPAASSPPAAPGPLAASIWLGAVLAVASLSLMAVPVLTPSIAADLDLSPHWLGLYSGLLWAAALVTSAGAGNWIQQHAPWRTVQICLALCLLGMLCATFAQLTPLFLLAAAILIGVANGIEAPVASLLLSRLVPRRQRTLLFSVKQTGVQWGALVGSLSLPALFIWIGWRGSLAVVAGVAAALLLAVRVFPARVTDECRGAAPPSQILGPVDPAPAPDRSAVHKGWFSWWASLGTHADLRRLACAAAAFGATQVCLNSFLVTFLVAEHGYSLASAGVLAACAQTGGLAGRLFWGWLATAWIQPMRLLYALGVAMSLSSILMGLPGVVGVADVWGAALVTALLWVIAVLFGLSASGWNGVFLAEVAARAPESEVARITGAVMVVMTMGLVLGPLLFAALARLTTFGAAYIGLGGVALLGSMLLPARAHPVESAKP